MVKTCIACGCSKAKTKNNVAIFSVPKDPVLFDAWKSNLQGLRKPLSVSSYVCEKHFHPSDIISHYIEKLPSETWSLPYGKKRLKSKAVPLTSNICMAPDNNNLLNNNTELMECNVDEPIEKNDDVEINTNVDLFIETNVDPANETNNVDMESNYNLSNKTSSNTVHVSTQTVLNIIDKSTQTVDHKEGDIEQHNNSQVLFTFDTLLMNLNKLKYSGYCNWVHIVAPDKKKVTFLSISTDNILRRVEIYDNLSSRVILEFIQVHEDFLHDDFQNMNEVIKYLTAVYNWNLCATLKNSKRFTSDRVCEGIASCDRQNMGRPTLRCMPCNVDIEARKWRKPPPVTKVKKVLKKKTLQQKVKRFKKKIESLETHVCELKQKCASVKEQTLDDAIHNLKEY
ncbi:hypothetical protein HCN44_000803 [Aphidius gifuensis]|uniref:THAP-type domain-containing protein n=1 Tax=Aphidius gifuensis TaxID=684658 RepID=A0A834XR26_APHGI|nr:uncharacterized protein LOC122854938 [Aphidius gifuensis]KAF7990998.1 hypothetical protein HCN44_000803 [Aphidius gifuensis]